MIENSFNIEDDDLRARLDMIMHEVPRFWENGRYPHFTNHGPAQSQHIQRTLAQLAQELPADRRLSSDEVFIVSSAAWLYEIGMQSPHPSEDVVSFAYDPQQPLTFEQLQEIREKKHILSYRLIQDSVREGYDGPPLHLGLTRFADNYIFAIIEICRGCSSEPLDEVTEKISINNMNVRIRLLTALLRLADQLYIENTRINIERLKTAPLPVEEKTRWWMYYYAQALPIDQGDIRFHYHLPSAYQQYVGHIRTLVEPDFTRANNPVIRYLWEKWNMRLTVHPQPEVLLEAPPGFMYKMSPEMLRYILREVAVDPSLIDRALPVKKPKEGEKVLLVLDYETFLLQLGRQGYFLSSDDVDHLVLALLKEVNQEYSGEMYELERRAVGHWERPDLAAVAPRLRRVFQLLTAREQQPVAQVLLEELNARLQGDDAPAQTLLIAPHEDLVEVESRFSERKLVLSTWISDAPEAEIYSALVRRTRRLSEILREHLPEPRRLSDEELARIRTACILRLDELLRTKRQAGIPIGELSALLEEVEGVKGSSDWWLLCLLNEKIIHMPEAGNYLVQLNPDHPRVSEVFASRDAVIQALLSLVDSGEAVPQRQIERNLERVQFFWHAGLNIADFLPLLLSERIVRNEKRPGAGQTIMWSLNPTHWRVIAARADQDLPLLVLSAHHFLVSEGYQHIHEHTLVRRLAAYVGLDVAKALYRQALRDGWVQAREAEKKQIQREESLVEVRLVEKHESVQQALFNRDMLLDTLYRSASSADIEREMLWNRLRQSRCTLSREEMNRWLDVFRRDSLVAFTSREGNVSLNLDSLLTQRLLGRFNIFGVVRTMTIMRARSVEQAKPVDEIVDRLALHVTSKQKQLARWALHYAESAKIVGLTMINAPGGRQEAAFLRDHPFTRNLYQREPQMCQALAVLVRDLVSRRFRNGRVPLPVLFQEMEKDRRFGLTRAEHQYWLGQATVERRHGTLRKQVESVGENRTQAYFMLATQEVH
jgi:hypothetical protein